MDKAIELIEIKRSFECQLLMKLGKNLIIGLLLGQIFKIPQEIIQDQRHL